MFFIIVNLLSSRLELTANVKNGGKIGIEVIFAGSRLPLTPCLTSPLPIKTKLNLNLDVEAVSSLCCFLRLFTCRSS